VILHLDTSALVKLYVEETHSERVRSGVAEASLVRCHELAYVNSVRRSPASCARAISATPNMHAA
jgi:hypothetical protein